MPKPVFAIYGASGFGRETMPIARAHAFRAGASREEVYFIDDNSTYNEINQHKVLSYTDFLDLKATQKFVSLAIANCEVRKKLSLKLANDGLYDLSLKAENAVILDEVKIESGYIISPFVTLTSNIKIGAYFHANIYSYVAHDCVIGDFVTFAPGVQCNGNVVVEDYAYIGTGAVIKQGKPGEPLVIGRGATVGMGAVVTKSVPAGSVVVGNPARSLAKV